MQTKFRSEGFVRLLNAFVPLLAVLPLHAQFVTTKGPDFVAPNGQVLQLKGTNLGNWMVPEGYMWHLKGPQSPREIEALTEALLGPEKAEAFWREYRDRYVTEADIVYLAKCGFNSLRVPLHYKFFVDEKGEGFRLLDRVVAWSRKAGLYLVLDLHCAPGGQTGTNIDDSNGYPWLFESVSAQQQLLVVWRNLARHYRDEPSILGYDLLNEPIPHFPALAKYNAALEPLLRRVVAEVRAVDPHHIVFLTGAQWDTNFKVLGAPFAENLAYTFHKYWMPPKQEAIQDYLDFRDRHHVPIWIGETGENQDEWIASFRKLLEEQHVGWAFWPYKKMDSTSCIVQFPRPTGWEAILAYSNLATGTGQAEKATAARPSQSEIEATFANLLKQVGLSSCKANPGYLQALGLTVPPVPGSAPADGSATSR